MHEANGLWPYLSVVVVRVLSKAEEDGVNSHVIHVHEQVGNEVSNKADKEDNNAPVVELFVKFLVVLHKMRKGHIKKRYKTEDEKTKQETRTWIQ